MPKNTFEISKEEVLVLKWKFVWRNLQITLNGRNIGEIPTHKELSAGKEFELPNGRKLWIKLASTAFAPELQVEIDGRPVPGSGSHPLQRLNIAVGCLAFVGVMSMGLGSIGFIYPTSAFGRIGMGFSSLIFGAIFVLLTFLVYQRSRAALIAATLLWVLDAVQSTFVMISAGNASIVGALMVKVLIAIHLIRAIPALDQLKEIPVKIK